MARTRGRLILGLNCAYHESAAALVQDGEVVFAIEEERLTRTKHAKTARVDNPDALPWQAIGACLLAVPDTSLSDLSAIAYSLKPNRRIELVGRDPYAIDDDTGFGTLRGEAEFNRRVLDVPHILARAAGDDSLVDRFFFVPHHRAHAASAFYASPFQHAAILVVDGIGETSTAWLGRGSAQGLEVIDEIPYPHSIGMLWERVALYLGFTEFDACKVMGLAAHGDPGTYRSEYNRLFQVLDHAPHSRVSDGLPFRIDPELARFRTHDVRGLESLFGPRRRDGERPDLARFANVAAGLQRQTEDALLALARRLAQATGEQALAYAGGVALNCVANARLEREGPFGSIFMLGAAHDAGTAIGAALDLAYSADADLRASRHPQRNTLSPYLGGSYDRSAIDDAISRAGGLAEIIDDPPRLAASLIAAEEVVGWFQGAMEFGPRALGHRSLLADPRSPRVRDKLNELIKHRESFRPFGASVLADDAPTWFEFPADRQGASSCRPFMIVAYPVRPERAARIPAVLHCDHTCRIQVVAIEQSPLFHSLIRHFRDLTGVPLVLNTSFNDQEPLVATPDDALRTFFANTHIDALFLGDRLVRRAR